MQAVEFTIGHIPSSCKTAFPHFSESNACSGRQYIDAPVIATNLSDGHGHLVFTFDDAIQNTPNNTERALRNHMWAKNVVVTIQHSWFCWITDVPIRYKLAVFEMDRSEYLHIRTEFNKKYSVVRPWPLRVPSISLIDMHNKASKRAPEQYPIANTSFNEFCEFYAKNLAKYQSINIVMKHATTKRSFDFFIDKVGSNFVVDQVSELEQDRLPISIGSIIVSINGRDFGLTSNGTTIFGNIDTRSELLNQNETSMIKRTERAFKQVTISLTCKNFRAYRWSKYF